MIIARTGFLCGNAKEKRDGVVGLGWCIPDCECTRGVHPFVCHLWIVTVNYVLQSLGGVHPCEPLLCIRLLVEVACKEPICFKPPALMSIHFICVKKQESERLT